MEEVRRRDTAQQPWMGISRTISVPKNDSFWSGSVYWECRELAACEVHPKTCRYQIGKGLPTTKQKLEALSKKNSYIAWDNIVEVYSGASLTRGTDRLVAISGLAKRLHGTLQDKYCAGLWEYDLVRHMMWRQKASLVPSSYFSLDMRSSEGFPSLEYIAPSWSWASVAGCVRFPDRRERDERGWDTLYKKDQRILEIEELLVELCDSENPFGAVRSCSLHVWGQLGMVKIPLENAELEMLTHMLLNEQKHHSDEGRPSQLSAFPTIQQAESRTSLLGTWNTLAYFKRPAIIEPYHSASDQIKTALNTRSKEFVPQHFSTEKSTTWKILYNQLRHDAGTSLYFLQLGHFRRYTKHYFGLVLKKVDGATNKFSRVGIFDTVYTTGEVYKWWINSFNSFDEVRDESRLNHLARPEGGFKYEIVLV